MKHSKPKLTRFFLTLIGLLLIGLMAVGPSSFGQEAGSAVDRLEDQLGMDRRTIGDFDLRNQSDSAGEVLPTPQQAAALDQFLSQHPNAVARWDRSGGGPDVIYGFASEPSSLDAEAAARQFIASQPDLLGVTDPSTLSLDSGRSRQALGGHLIRFNQVHEGIRVYQSGIGVVLDGQKRVRALSGPYYRDIDIDTTPTFTAAQAVQLAADDLAPHGRSLPPEALEQLNPAFGLLEAQLGALLTEPHPEPAIFPSADGHRLAWSFFYYSRNPFGLYRYLIDAHTGELLYRENFVRTQEDPTAITADYFPTSPPITPQLQDEGIIVDADSGTAGVPLGQLRIQVRKIDQSSRTTGVEDLITGTHATITNALPARLPFEQPPLGTWHFAQDNQPVEGRTNEVDHLAHPANYQDGMSQFIYITSLIEYLDYLHREGDQAHAPFGQGHFPDSYPNDETPLSGTVHIPNVLEDICGDLPPETDPNFTRQLLACDNAFAIPVSEEIAGQQIVVNPTAYGHGWLFNDLAWDFAVPLHEGTHATITPIAGFEGSPEGGALNEGQADLFAYTIGENPSLGAYIVNAFRLRRLLRDLGGDPDDFRWIRNADSQLRYSQLGTRGNAFEVHRDGEIYAGAMWDIRQIMHQYQTGGPFLRPNPITGEATDPIPTAKETWERLFLGSMYVLGAMSPDTFVRARDATIIADSFLYPIDATDPETSGRHRALIEQVFAAREMGVNAGPPLAGRQAISTALTSFTVSQDRPPVPQGVTAVPASTTSIRVSWEPVDGAIAYQVLKRVAGGAQKRLFGGVPGREYHDADNPDQLSGYTHIEFVYGGSTTSHLDNGQSFGVSPGLGLDSLDFEYVVRALAVNPNGQVGFSDLSGTASAPLELNDVTDSLQPRITSAFFNEGVFSIDQTLENIGADAIYTPITFKIIDISEDSVTVRNADNGGSGQNGDEAQFAYQPSLAAGETSAARTIEFNDPPARLFTFDAVTTGRLEGEPVPANGSQPPDGEADPVPRPETFHFIEEFTGVVPVGTAGLELAEGVDFVDVPFTTKPSASAVVGTLSADASVGPLPDLDFFLYDDQGNQLDSSGNFGPNEEVGAPVQGNRTYVYRVQGFANGPSTFRIVSDQQVEDPDDAGTGMAGGASGGSLTTYVIRFTVDPLTGEVTTQILN